MRAIFIIAVVAALVVVSAAGASGPITGKVGGVFTRSAYDGTLDQAHLKRYIKTSNVWCGWQDNKVLVHVRMRNRSAEHVTVNWYPPLLDSRWRHSRRRLLIGAVKWLRFG